MSNIDGRCITIARIRAGMTSVEVARQLYYTVPTVSLWERGKRKSHWDQLYALLPELPKIREDGCAKYCPKASMCKKDGNCLIAYAVKAARKSKDIVEVVRCKNCNAYNKDEGYCERLGITCLGNDFCSYGERGCDDG